ncbi:hypothetical protein BC828DRAFT_400378 [Blastocladiella britannica]|nr:hypothetical protein BC828DRAFT_400378 [Blastocladiella britannica]
MSPAETAATVNAEIPDPSTSEPLPPEQPNGATALADHPKEDDPRSIPKEYSRVLWLLEEHARPGTVVPVVEVAGWLYHAQDALDVRCLLSNRRTLTTRACTANVQLVLRTACRTARQLRLPTVPARPSFWVGVVDPRCPCIGEALEQELRVDLLRPEGQAQQPGPVLRNGLAGDTAACTRPRASSRASADPFHGRSAQPSSRM